MVDGVHHGTGYRVRVACRRVLVKRVGVSRGPWQRAQLGGAPSDTAAAGQPASSPAGTVNRIVGSILCTT